MFYNMVLPLDVVKMYRLCLNIFDNTISCEKVPSGQNRRKISL